MSSQIYSRYIPPAKQPKAPATIPDIVQKPIPEPPVNAKLQPLPTRNDASATYARYVPPSKFKSPAVSMRPVAPIIEPSPSPSGSKRSGEGLGDATDQPRSKRPKKAKNGDAAPKFDSGPTATSDDVDLMGRLARPNKQSEEARQCRNVAPGGDQHIPIPEEAEAEDARHNKLMRKREKSLKKAERMAKNAAAEPAPESLEDILQDEGPLQDLVPLPQPDPIPEPPTLNIPSSLPTWLASPIRVLPTATAQFSDLGVPQDATDMLVSKGFHEAFAVQAATLPLLLPGQAQKPGDVLISAATGSGKTLAYVLPMVEELSRNAIAKLRALIIVPTRELVIQARDVSELCASAFATGSRRRVKIGTALGNANFKTEQASLIEQNLAFDPQTYRTELARLNSKWEGSDQDSDEDDEMSFIDAVPGSRLPDHVSRPSPKVDILICTPGRLVEHLKSTPGFSLQHVNWLVVDEADKLLDQSFQRWLDVVMLALPAESHIAQHRSNHVRKIILSATLTKDIGQLSALKLYRPILIVLEGSSSEEISKREQDSHAHVLPSLLVEAAIKVDEEPIKPLYLLELLRRENLLTDTASPKLSHGDFSSDSSSDSSSGSNTSDDMTDDESVTSRDSLEAVPKQAAPSTSSRGVLVFTKSNETAVRLGRLIALLEPNSPPTIATLTSTTRSSTRRAALKAFGSKKLSILIASDLVSRGLDLPDLAHVVNYDVPTSVASYVHRVGRTARAGKPGHAWTLFTAAEAWWFWNEIARSSAVERAPSSKVLRVNINASQFNEEQRANYEATLEALKLEAIQTSSSR
ncbi:uncharacterized protein BP5553_07423 [Venustampulla echinocandica]|uniref:ATP-dependent RNA helicase n=1 Tax=Venustampulla echinocandica TaxID=2656787 RepID=A0A370TJH3_9HELO|nr:uncharacterized protein BP5553_07423 [Venustampulla echinocandica]RDL35492.1 hypothetical protein BP5553_07423 [Venustampulla echinocandica]